jgi:hypothetical protein
MVLSKKEWLVLTGIIVVFFVLRIPGVNIPYHQDEYKWPMYAEEKVFAPGSIPHPPLTEFIYRVVGKHIGFDNFRFVPLLFSTANILLIFYLAKLVFDKRTAFWAAMLFAISYLSILASLMVDVDGSVMPFFFLLSAIFYYKLRDRNFVLKEGGWKWLVLFLLSASACFLVKISGVLPLGAFALDFALCRGLLSDKKRFLKFLGLGAGAIALVVAVLLLAKLLFPFFPIDKSLVYWRHFADSSNFLGRGWMQIFIQFVKSIMYLSPLLVLPALFTDREVFKRARPLYLFIAIGLIFYLFLFDFSLGALDRYLQFLVIPLSIISGAILGKYFSANGSTDQKVCLPDIIAVSIISFGIFAMQFFQQFVPPLYPKTEWLSRLVSFKWNFLFPFTGGSGPIPFYVSFQFIVLLWIVSIVFAALALWKKEVIKRSLFAVLVFGLVYNVVFAEEYLFGRINGSSTKLVRQGVEYIENDPEIKKVIVYNDNGGWDVRTSGKYERRMYATPQFEAEYREVLSKFSGHILYVNAPRVALDSFYQKYFDACQVVFEKQDKYITGHVLNCTKR